MFVYSGKLNWLSYAKDETFTVVFPNGPVRAGDNVFLFSQWTEDSKKIKKNNWFSNLAVEAVHKTAAGDDTFTLKGSWYSFVVTTEKAYSKISILMSNPSNAKSNMTLDRIWFSEGEQTNGTTRIWTGKMNWLDFASDEAAIFIVPDGFGEGKPVLSMWQWTKDSSGKKNSPSFRHAVQKMDGGAAQGTVKFSYKSYYDIVCTWDEKTEKLSVNMKESGPAKDIGEMGLSALVDRHSHDFNPPETNSIEKGEVELRLPQPIPTLPHISTAMPFPKGLFATLTHAASFVDQAGYLAQYAEKKFQLLDADLHDKAHQIENLKAENAALKKTIQDLTAQLAIERAKVADLEKRLAEAQAAAGKKQAELEKRIKDLEEAIRKDAISDEEARKLFEKACKELAEARALIDKLQKQLSDANAKIASLEAQLAANRKLLADLQKAYDDLLLKYKALELLNDQLNKEVVVLKSDKDALQGKLAASQRQIADLSALVEELKHDKANLVKQRDQAIEERRKVQAKVNAADQLAAEARQEAKEAIQKRDEYEDMFNKVYAHKDSLEALLAEKQIEFTRYD